MPHPQGSFFPKMQNLFKRKHSQKASQMGSLIAYERRGKPVWTPRQYESLSLEGYQKNVIVYRCVTLIARSIGSIPWIAVEKDTPYTEHAVLNLLKSPSPYQAGSSFMEAVVSFLLLSGNSYIEAAGPDTGIPEELYVLRPDRMKVIPHASGTVEGYEYTINGHKRVISVDPLTGKGPILHIKFFHPLHDWYGMSPLEAALISVDQHNGVSSHNLSLLQNGGRPSGAFIVKTEEGIGLTDTQRDTLRSDVRSMYEGAHNAGKVLLLEGDFDWREMGLSPKDLDFVEGKLLSAREIAQAFGVPPMLVGVPGESTFSNYKEARFHLWEDTILPLVNFIVAELNLWLAPQFGENIRLEYDLDDIPALSPRREALWSRIESASFLTNNEKRELLGFPPLSE